jgi:glycosyltransferase involved in cell wall biosynthesis
MKVLQIINSLHTGGAERLLVDSVPLYKAKGLETDVCLLNGNRTSFYQVLEEQHICIISLSKGSIKSVYNPLLIFKIFKYINRYAVIHVHIFPTLYWVALAKFLSFGKTKLVFTEHSTSNRRRNSRIWRFFNRIAYKQYDAIASISEDVDKALQKHLLLKKDVFSVINNGIDLSKFYGKAKNATDTIKDITLIQVSRFSPAKDQATVIRALSYLQGNVKLVFVGDGVNRTECELLTKQLDLSERVSFLGSRNDIPELLKNADIAVQSSQWEGFGLAAVEAMASGLPIVASDVSGLREVVSGAGLLFKQGDEKSLADKINSLLTDRKLYEKIANLCLERAKQYDINVMVEQYIDLYKEVLNQ